MEEAEHKIDYWKQKFLKANRENDRLQYELRQIRFDVCDYACGYTDGPFFRSIEKEDWGQPGDFNSPEEAAQAFGWGYLFEKEDTSCVLCDSENGIYFRFNVGMICEDCKS